MPATLITAHNGADGTVEDSMEYVRHALASDADVMEIDIRRLKDGRLVFTHDLPDILTGAVPPASPVTVTAPGTARTVCVEGNMITGGKARTLPAADMAASARLVSIEEVFPALRESSKLVNCDLKESGLESAVAALAKRCGVADRLLYSGTVDAGYCRETGLSGRVKILLNIEEYIPNLYERCKKDPGQLQEAAREICAVCQKYGILVVNANYRLATDPFIDILEKHGIGLSAWTVDGTAEAERLLKRGIFNLTTRNLCQILPLSKTIRSSTFNGL